MSQNMRIFRNIVAEIPEFSDRFPLKLRRGELLKTPKLSG